LIFSPAFLLAYLVPEPSFRQLDLYCFLLLGLTAFSVLMLFKDKDWHPAGAAVAALAAAFGGSCNRQEHNTQAAQSARAR
jgi:hypothetical protein